MKLFIDIETAPETNIFKDEFRGNAFDLVSSKVVEPKDFELEFAINPCFGKVICIGIAYVSQSSLNVTCIHSSKQDGEAQILKDFMKMLTKGSSNNVLIAHNGKEFDFPFLAKRFLANDLSVPSILQTAGKKPWEVSNIDTLELWKFGSFQGRASLENICHCLNIPSPKNKMKGSDVPRAYYEGRIDEICNYCAQDVEALARVYNAITSDQETVFTTKNFMPYVCP